MKKALLVIGDRKATKWKLAKSFNAFVKHIKRETKSNKNFELKIISYKDVLSNNIPAFMGRIITVILFFPFDYWNKYIEVYDKDNRIYVDVKFGRDYENFLKNVEGKLKEAYKGKKIKYFNSPSSSLLERDKKRSKYLFQKKGILVPRVFRVRNTKDIRKLINAEKSIYIKPRFGAMGKGITYLSKDFFVTNFIYRKSRIVSRKSDFGWRFHSINKKDRERFLKRLVLKDFIFEEAIEHPVYNGRRFDFRVHVVLEKTPYFYVKSMPMISPVSNWTQGGRIEKKENFSKFVSRRNIKKVKSLAMKATKALNLSYAAVDIIISKDFKKVYCLEAHSFPGYEKRFDIMRYIAKQIIK